MGNWGMPSLFPRRRGSLTRGVDIGVTRKLMIKVQDLVKIFGKRRVVDGVSLDVKEGEVVGLLGSNGAGKTTTFTMVVGLVKPSAGQIFLDNKPIGHLAMYQRARLGVSYLAQEPSVFRHLTVEDNLRLVWQE